jgi:hypothetical protein
MSALPIEWRLENRTAGLSCGRLQGRVEFDSQGTRFIVESWGGRPIKDWTALATFGPNATAEGNEITDSYVRGPDLVITFAKRRPFQFAPQIYWRARAHRAPAAVQIELMFSIQTDLLDSNPESCVTSRAHEAALFHTADLNGTAFAQLPLGETQRSFGHEPSSTHLFVFRSGALGVSYAQMVHPSDFVRVKLVGSDAFPSVESTLFPERLEKGVIRRGRICGWFMSAESDLETAAALARQFVEEPLPLTT